MDVTPSSNRKAGINKTDVGKRDAGMETRRAAADHCSIVAHCWEGAKWEPSAGKSAAARFFPLCSTLPIR